ncbi:MAG: hypothetical protein RLZZ511_3003 [Cyanobacteriota bacterium]|jgi:hypothetical protein
MHPSYQIPPPIGSTPVPVTQMPPLGGPLNPTHHEVTASTDSMVPSYPLTPAIGSYAGTNPQNMLTPQIGAVPSNMVAQMPITPPINGPAPHQGYLNLPED